jgi:hypothetical protein
MVTLAGGSTVSRAVFELAKAVPVAVDPEIETLKEVGELTARPGGIENKTRSVVPAMTDTLVAAVIALGALPPGAVKETVTLDPGIVPAGKFEPITVIDDTPGWPEEGAVSGDKLTCVTCATEAPAAKSVHARRIAERTRDRVRKQDFRSDLVLGTVYPPNQTKRREILVPPTDKPQKPVVIVALAAVLA